MKRKTVWTKEEIVNQFVIDKMKEDLDRHRNAIPAEYEISAPIPRPSDYIDATKLIELHQREQARRK